MVVGVVVFLCWWWGVLVFSGNGVGWVVVVWHCWDPLCENCFSLVSIRGGCLKTFRRACS